MDGGSAHCVEALALRRYLDIVGDGWRGMHCENALWLTLHGLLRRRAPRGGQGAVARGWSTPFSDQPTAMRRPPFSRASPCECHSQFERYTSSEQLIAALRDAFAIATQRTGRAERSASTAAMRVPQDCAARGVNWAIIRDIIGEGGGVEIEKVAPLGQLETIVRNFGAAVVQCIVDALDADYCTFSHGLPDLVLYRATPGGDSDASHEASSRCCCNCGAETSSTTTCPAAAHAMFVEVKGPGDSLSSAQIDWIHRLREAGAHVELCKIGALTGRGRE